MSHEKGTVDFMTGTYKFWHGLNEVYPVIDLDDPKTCALARWDAQKTPATFTHPETGQPVGTGENYIVSKLEDGSFLQVSKSVADSYRLFTNKELLEVANEVKNAVKGSTVVTTGSVRDRRQVFVSLRLPVAEGGEFDIDGHRLLNSFSILNSFDMSCPIVGTCSATDTVCANTFALNMAHGMDGENVGSTVAIHKQGLDIEVLKKNFIASAQLNKDFAEEFQLMGRWLVDSEDARSFFAGFVARKRATLTTRSAGMVERLYELFQKGAGSRAESARDVFGAVTNYYTHESTGKNGPEQEKNHLQQWLSSEFGDASQAKRIAFDWLTDPDQYCETIIAGEELWRSWLKDKSANNV